MSINKTKGNMHTEYNLVNMHTEYNLVNMHTEYNLVNMHTKYNLVNNSKNTSKVYLHNT